LLAFTASQRADSGERTDCSPAFVIQNPDLRAAFADRDRQRNPEWNELCGRIRAATAGESRNSL
jgi:hypothetical protein